MGGGSNSAGLMSVVRGCKELGIGQATATLEPLSSGKIVNEHEAFSKLNLLKYCRGFPCGTSGQEPAYQCRLDIRDADSISGLGRSPRGGHGNLLQYSCLENPIDRGVWRPTVHGVTKSRTQLKRLNTPHTADGEAEALGTQVLFKVNQRAGVTAELPWLWTQGFKTSQSSDHLPPKRSAQPGS